MRCVIHYNYVKLCETYQHQLLNSRILSQHEIYVLLYFEIQDAILHVNSPKLNDYLFKIGVIVLIFVQSLSNCVQ